MYIAITNTGVNLPTGILVIAIMLSKSSSPKTGMIIVLPKTFKIPFL